MTSVKTLKSVSSASRDRDGRLEAAQPRISSPITHPAARRTHACALGSGCDGTCTDCRTRTYLSGAQIGIHAPPVATLDARICLAHTLGMGRTLPILLVVALAVAACGHRSSQTAASADYATITVARLTRPFVNPPFDPTARSVANFRFDVAPASDNPHMNADMVGAAVKRSAVSSYLKTSGTRASAFFGLFTGSAAIVGPPPNHTLLGNRPIDRRASWMVVVTNIDTTGWNPPRPPGVGPVHMANPIYAITVFNDADGLPTNDGTVETGSGDPTVS